MMDIINLTKHPLTILCPDPDGVEATVGRGPSARVERVAVIGSIPPSGVEATAREESEDSSPVEIGGHLVPTRARRFGAPANLPDPQEGVILFVSAITLAAAAASGRDTGDLVVPGESAYAEGKVIGVLSLARQG